MSNLMNKKSMDDRGLAVHSSDERRLLEQSEESSLICCNLHHRCQESFQRITLLWPQLLHQGNELVFRRRRVVRCGSYSPMSCGS